MSAHETDAELDRLRAAVASGDNDAVERCLALLERRAGDFERAGDDAAAIDALSEAEGLQWRIGTWATGSGEGLASMWHVYELMLGRARAEQRLAESTTGEESERHRAAAEALIERVRSDPNGLGVELLKKPRART